MIVVIVLVHINVVVAVVYSAVAIVCVLCTLVVRSRSLREVPGEPWTVSSAFTDAASAVAPSIVTGCQSKPRLNGCDGSGRSIDREYELRPYSDCGT